LYLNPATPTESVPLTVKAAVLLLVVLGGSETITVSGGAVSCTLMVKLAVLELPCASVAVSVMVCVPIAKL